MLLQAYVVVTWKFIKFFQLTFACWSCLSCLSAQKQKQAMEKLAVRHGTAGELTVASNVVTRIQTTSYLLAASLFLFSRCLLYALNVQVVGAALLMSIASLLTTKVCLRPKAYLQNVMNVARNRDWTAVTASLSILAHVAQSCCTVMLHAAGILKSRSSTCM